MRLTGSVCGHPLGLLAGLSSVGLRAAQCPRMNLPRGWSQPGCQPPGTWVGKPGGTCQIPGADFLLPPTPQTLLLPGAGTYFTALLTDNPRQSPCLWPARDPTLRGTLGLPGLGHWTLLVLSGFPFRLGELLVCQVCDHMTLSSEPLT